MKILNYFLLTVVVFLVIVLGYFLVYQKTTIAPVKVTPVAIIATTTQVQENVAKPVELEPMETKNILFDNGKKIQLQMPINYSIVEAAENMQHPRFMAWSPDHRLFVGDMTNASDNTTGRVLVLDGFDKTAGKFKSMDVYLANLRNPNSVAFYTDKNGVTWIYVANTDKLLRYQYVAGETKMERSPEVIAEFPTYGQSLAEGGWHLTRTVIFNGDDMYVSVGSSCNSCEEIEADRATILKMNPDGTNKEIFASGIRNAVGIMFANGKLYGTANEIDHIGNDKPNDNIYQINEGDNYGWPYCYQYEGRVYPENSKTWKKDVDCTKVPLAWANVEPHSAPLGLQYFDNSFADQSLWDSFLVATHGSGKPKIGTGYKVSIVRKNEKPIDLITGFLQNGVRIGRPVDILQYDKNSFFLTDDFNGAVYFVSYNQ